MRDKNNNIIGTSGEIIKKIYMIEFKWPREIYLYSENIDMRLGTNKIQILVGVNFKAEEIRIFHL